MKFFRDLMIIALAVAAIACSNDKPNNVDLGPAPQPITPNALNGQTATQPGAAAVALNHYICPNNCAGSGGPNAGVCPTCGTQYAHNAAYHNQAQPQSNPATQQAAQASTAPGLYHYTCPNGCTGGAGMAQPCPTCGTQLAHNAAFHQQQGGATGGATVQPNNGKSPLFVDPNSNN